MQFWQPIIWFEFDQLFYTLLYDYIYLIYFMITSILIIFIGFCGLLYKKLNIINLLLALELIFLGFNLFFVFIALYYENPQSYLLIIILLTLAGAESAIGFSILIAFFRVKKTILLSAFNKLRF